MWRLYQFPLCPFSRKVRLQLAEKGVVANDITSAIAREHVEAPGGQLVTGERNIDVRLLGEALDLDSLKKLVVRRVKNTPVYLEDVALVEDGFEDANSVSRLDGEPMQTLGVPYPADAREHALDDARAQGTTLVKELADQGLTAAPDSELVALIGGGRRPDESLNDDALDMVREQFRAFTLRRITPFAHGWHLADALIPGEQFGVGGADSVRGFYERQIADDRGQRYGLELQTPDFGNYLNVPDLRVNALAFIDGARVDRNHVLASEKTHESIGSNGLGLRIGYTRHASLRLDWARVTQGGADRRAGDNRLHANLLLLF